MNYELLNYGDSALYSKCTAGPERHRNSDVSFEEQSMS
jgi:hypothetical protein